MRACLSSCVLLSLFLTIAMAAVAAVAPPEPAEPQQRVLRPEEPVQAQPALSPLMQEIEAVLAADEAAVTALNEQLATAPDEQAALHILGQIRQQKQDTELAILRIQQRHALKEGETAAAERIGLAIDRILNPPQLQPDSDAAATSRERRAGGGDHD
jgi:TolA-binding protein